MPRMRDKLRGVQESAGGFADIEPGAYKLVITKAEPVEKQQYVRLYWDVADGESKGAYAKSQWPPSDVISWKESAAGMLKGKLHRLALCNPRTLHPLTDADGNFESLQEFEDDDWAAFKGKFFAAVVRRRLYTAGPRSKTPGADKTSIEVARWLTPEEFRNEDWPKSLLDDNDQRDRTQGVVGGGETVASVPADYGQPHEDDLYGEDIPF